MFHSRPLSQMLEEWGLVKVVLVWAAMVSMCCTTLTWSLS